MKRLYRPLALNRRVYPVPRWERAAARNWFELEHPHPVRVRHASQVMVLDQQSHGLVTWLTQRQPDSPLGSIAPPSALVEPVDDDNVRWFGPSAREWAARIGTDDVAGARRSVMAAVRGLFLETGILLAGVSDVDIVDSLGSAEWTTARSEIQADSTRFSQWIEHRGWGLRTDLLRFVCRWESADYALRRVESTVFAIALPVGQEVSLPPGGDGWGAWVSVDRDEAAKQIAEPDGPASSIEPGRTWPGNADPSGAAMENSAAMNSATKNAAPWSEAVAPPIQAVMEEVNHARGLVAFMSQPRAWSHGRMELIHRMVGGFEWGLKLVTDHPAEQRRDT
ncbi:hypothetical protein [Pseudoglutamicibacter albus]|uniref:Uncharacterized protein n=1 Tax=Pseudoglutamicibacter albus TaxID=98671 RepID=A0ABU1Z0Z2_9MICC|nr:hypothetical protein [Pseudoglutamicibacter albus]MDR7294238.1 hypothetical protein [Pseudoglutamicibacter albus]